MVTNRRHPGRRRPLPAGVSPPLRHRAHLPHAQADARLDQAPPARLGGCRPLDLAGHRRPYSAPPCSTPTSGGRGRNRHRRTNSPRPASGAGSGTSARRRALRPVRRNPPHRALDARRARRSGDPQPATTWDESSPAVRHTNDQPTTKSAPNPDEPVQSKVGAHDQTRPRQRPMNPQVSGRVRGPISTSDHEEQAHPARRACTQWSSRCSMYSASFRQASP